MNNKELSYTISLQATRFEDSAGLLFKVGSFDPNKYYIPAWVLAAFSLELHLKSILQFESGTIKKTHRIKDIFDELSKESKKRIRANFENEMLTHPSPNAKQVEKASGTKIEEDFDSVLDDISSLFVDFRYIFEPKKEARSFMFIDNLRRSITDRVRDLGINSK